MGVTEFMLYCDLAELGVICVPSRLSALMHCVVQSYRI